jgi:hypothetical protein
MGRIHLHRVSTNQKYQIQSRSNQLHRIPPSLLLLLSIASTLSPFIIIKNGQSETNSTQNNWG